MPNVIIVARTDQERDLLLFFRGLSPKSQRETINRAKNVLRLEIMDDDDFVTMLQAVLETWPRGDILRLKPGREVSR